MRQMKAYNPRPTRGLHGLHLTRLKPRCLWRYPGEDDRSTWCRNGAFADLWWYEIRNSPVWRKMEFFYYIATFHGKIKRYAQIWANILCIIPLEISLRAIARGFESLPLRQNEWPCLIWANAWRYFGSGRVILSMNPLHCKGFILSCIKHLCCRQSTKHWNDRGQIPVMPLKYGPKKNFLRQKIWFVNLAWNKCDLRPKDSLYLRLIWMSASFFPVLRMPTLSHRRSDGFFRRGWEHLRVLI